MVTSECAYFAGAVVVLTAVWVWVLRSQPFEFLAYAMFFPGAAAFAWSAWKGSIGNFLWTISGFDQPLLSAGFSLMSVCIVLGLVQACALVARGLGWAQRAEVQGAAIHRHNRNYVMGFLRAAGEEVGWRCFLLPCLLDVYNYRYDQALVISGLVWGLFHVPVMALLTRLKRPDQPYATVTVQCLSCLLAAFPHGWVAIKTGHSLWGASVMHWFWNIYNPRTLGSIYTNTPGRYCGPQWKINGEGLAGCIVLAPVAILVCWELANPIF